MTIPINMGRAPPNHTTQPCVRCEWQRLHFNLKHHIHIREEIRT